MNSLEISEENRKKLKWHEWINRARFSNASSGDPIALIKKFHQHRRKQQLCLCFLLFRFWHIAEKVPESWSFQVNHPWRVADSLCTKAILSSMWAKKRKTACQTPVKRRLSSYRNLRNCYMVHSFSKWERISSHDVPEGLKINKREIVTACHLCLYTRLSCSYSREI